MTNTVKINFNKAYGQNFIFDLNLLKAIVSDANICKDDNVLEIGAGAGTLTKSICEKAKKVVAFEIDNNLKDVLNENLLGLNNVTLIFNDFMKVDASVIDNLFNGEKYKVVANLPYYITTPIIFKLLEECNNISELNIMVQREVADRICAKENTENYGALTASIGIIADAYVSRKVSRKMFLPMPNVDSAVVKIIVNRNKYNIKDISNTRKLIKGAFLMRRKTLENNLKSQFGISGEVARDLLNTLGLDIKIRGEALSSKQFVDLANLLVDKNIK